MLFPVLIAPVLLDYKYIPFWIGLILCVLYFALTFHLAFKSLFTEHFQIGLIFIVSASFFMDSKKRSQSEKAKAPRFDPKALFLNCAMLSGVALFLILVNRLPEGQFLRLLGTWYFTGTIWVFFLSVLTYNFFEKIQGARRNDALEADSGGKNLVQPQDLPEGNHIGDKKRTHSM